MRLRAIEMTEELAKEVSSWKYGGEYSIYNLPSWEEMVRDKYSLCNAVKRNRYSVYVNDDNEIIGFVNLLDEGESVFFGIGVNPKYCSMGYGKEITRLAVEQSRVKYPNKPLILEVRTWNERAVSCYRSQGFEIIEKKVQETCLGIGEFYVMKL